MSSNLLAAQAMPISHPTTQTLLLDQDLHRIVMATANLPVSIPRGRGRRVVTLYEAQIRKLASGRVHRRAVVMAFIGLVQAAAAHAPKSGAPAEVRKPTVIVRLEERLGKLRTTAAMDDSTELDQSAVRLCALLLDVVRQQHDRRS